LQELSQVRIEAIARQLQHWQIKPNGTEGYRTAEVTLGGVDCNELSSRTMESSKVAGLYFVGEVVDVTGWLGGYNFQWAWSSGWCAGQVVKAGTMQARPCIKAIRPRQLLSCRQCGRKMAVSFVRYLLLLFCLGGTSVMDVYGNDEAYNLHLRTADLWLPWQPIAPHSSHHPTGKPYICPLRILPPTRPGKRWT